MQPGTLVLILLFFSACTFYLGRKKALSLSSSGLHSLPRYYGYYAALWCGLPALSFLVLGLALDDYLIARLVIAALPESAHLSPQEQDLLLNRIKNSLSGDLPAGDLLVQTAADYYLSLKLQSRRVLTALVLSAAAVGGALAYARIKPRFKARNQVEKTVEVFLIASSALAILTTVGIVLSVLFESLRFFRLVPLTEFLFGLNWSPQMAIRADQVGASGAFGFLPLLTGTLLVSAIAMAVAVPLGLLAAIYLGEFASSKLRAVVKPLLEILAGVPTVVYGFFAALIVSPLLRQVGEALGLSCSSESALGAGLVMGIMIIPFVSSISEDVIHAVPQSLRDGAYALGATRAEAITQVVIPAALPGIVGGILLAVSRAVGETMIVVMAAGLTAKLTFNPLDSVTTITVQIVSLLIGDQEFDSPKTLAAFALGLMLFIITLALNALALYVVRTYRESYE